MTQYQQSVSTSGFRVVVVVVVFLLNCKVTETGRRHEAVETQDLRSKAVGKQGRRD